LADRVLAGHALTAEDGIALLLSPDEQLLEILAAAYRVRLRYFGNTVSMNFLINAKSGLCGEDCGYCSQSRVSTAEIPKYNLVEPEKILDGARMTAELDARTYCIVLSGRTPGERELDVLAEVVPQIKQKYRLAVCASVGLLTHGQAEKIKAAGVDRVNHNLNTSRRFYPRICSTHSYEDRLETLRTVRAAGLEICSGGIIGMGEDEVDVVDLALQLGQLQVEATPINFLQPIPGTPLVGTWLLNPRYCLKVLSLFRLSNPKCELRIAAGR
jgi:biotin synthase